MDFLIQNIKAFVCLAFAPEKHTAHKTMRVPCLEHGMVLYRAYTPPDICRTLGGLLNVPLMAVDFTNYRESDCLFAFIRYLSDCRSCGCRLIYILSAWQCYIAKYP